MPSLGLKMPWKPSGVDSRLIHIGWLIKGNKKRSQWVRSLGDVASHHYAKK